MDTMVEDRPAGIKVGMDFQIARKAMIDSQLRTSGVNAPFVLGRMASVPREDFVPENCRSIAYMDRAVPLGNGRFLSAALFHGLMIQEAEPSQQDKVLLVEGGSAYLAELMRPLVATLDVISPEAALTKTRKQTKYDLILIDGAVEHIPASLIARMADNGRVVAGLCEGTVTCLVTGRKTGKEAALMPLIEIGIPILPEFAKIETWSF